MLVRGIEAPRRPLLVGRVSRGERQQDPESQLLPLRQAAARLGWVPAGEIKRKMSAWDDDEAARFQADVFAELARTGANVLMVWSWDRWDRGGIASALALLDRLERHLGVDFYSLQEPFLSTATADKEMREFMVALIAWNAGRESDRRSSRLVAKAGSKRETSAKLGQRARWGKGHLATPAEVDRVRELHALGYSLRAIEGETGVPKSQAHRILRGEVKSA